MLLHLAVQIMPRSNNMVTYLLCSFEDRDRIFNLLVNLGLQVMRKKRRRKLDRQEVIVGIKGKAYRRKTSRQRGIQLITWAYNQNKDLQTPMPRQSPYPLISSSTLLYSFPNPPKKKKKSFDRSTSHSHRFFIFIFSISKSK